VAVFYIQLYIVGLAMPIYIYIYIYGYSDYSLLALTIKFCL